MAKSADQRRRELGERLKNSNSRLLSYMFFGFIAAVINTVLFMIFRQVLKDSVFIANTVAFILSNLASFYFNNKAVFTTNVNTNRKLWQKLVSFFTFRIISLLPDTLIMMVGIKWLHWNAFWVKIIDQILVGIFNYLTTKAVFQKTEHKLLKKVHARIQDHKNSASLKWETLFCMLNIIPPP